MTATRPTGRTSFWIDRGGTFTDVVARDEAGRLFLRKVLSEDPARPEDAAVRAIRDVLGLAPGAPLDPRAIESVRMGTTVATNALLERRGCAVCLVTTAGFEDALLIGTQERPELFALAIRKPEPLVAETLGVDERVLADGTVERPLDLEALRPRLLAVLGRGVRSLAVVLMNAYAYPAHERRIGELARALGFEHVGLSHEVSGLIRLVARGDTTTADAYLSPVLRAYVDRVAAALGHGAGEGAGEGAGGGVSLRFMQSSGGLAHARRFAGKDAILSGPAGGVVASAHVARQSGLRRVIGFDMGGTSTDVCRVDAGAEPERVFERVVAGVRIQAPMLDVQTIAAGGGSLLRFDGRRLTVGPDSAGAVPGPVCYRRPGGRLALTDANAVLGRVQPAFFPACFGPGGDERLDAAAARERLAEVAGQVGLAGPHAGPPPSAEEVAAGFVRVANDAMAQAIREVSVARGYDVTEYALNCFGGAGAQHACAVAGLLGVRTVLVHPLAGFLCAYGLGLADVTHQDVRSVLRPLADVSRADLEATFAELEARGRAALAAEGFHGPAAPARAAGVAPGSVRCLRSVDLRYRGVDATLDVPWQGAGGSAAGAESQDLAQRAQRATEGDDLAAAFAAAHRRLYGFDRPGHEVEVASVRVTAIGAGACPDEAPRPAAAAPAGPPRATVEAWFDEVGPDGARAVGARATPLWRREDLPPGAALEGPALVVDAGCTVVVDPGWGARVDGHGTLVLEAGAAPRRERAGTARDPVLLEIMANLFMSIAEQMGRTLERVSLSVNIKERLDFSCALFDAGGGLVANAPHIPVHLGAMSESVRAVLASRRDDLRPGDVVLTNDPYRGGSHLPDLTVVTPVFDAGALAFVVACRGHHADVGGVVPGSMPPFSRRIEEEGVLVTDLLLVRDGRMRRDEARAALSAGPYPARGVDERLADLEAQVAANEVGVRLLRELCARYGRDVVSAYMRHVQDDGAAALREAIARLPQGTSRFVDHLDDGAKIECALTVAGDRARVDFTGTDPRLPGNLNAPRAVVLACVLYVFRTLVARPIPLNQGCLEPLEVVVPGGSLLSPEAPDAVVGGNVETSQRICDVLYGALGKLGAAQGTMNNLTFGTARYGYYETICGGAGAGLGFDGASAVHTHMTNTKITDPEVLERRYPVVVRRFAIRRGSGGQGVYRGGDGVVRALELREPMEAAILSERRAVGPYGAHGAGSGAPGRNWLVRGRERRGLPGKVRLTVEPGDVLVVETPGGGGYDPTPGEWAALAPREARRLFREGRYRGPTSGIAAAHAQANLLVVPRARADAFEAYCRANPAPCPLLERLAPGDPVSRVAAPGADLRVDLPRYRVVGPGAPFEDRDDLLAAWSRDHVGFLLGCSFSAEGRLLAAGVPVRHQEEGKNVPMYRTSRETVAVPPFRGRLVVTMRPVPAALAARAAEVTAPCWFAHGAPLHRGDPAELGIADLARPDWGDAVTVREGEVPVFWACGVTSQEAVVAALEAGDLGGPVLAHAPGHMLVCDLTVDALASRAP